MKDILIRKNLGKMGGKDGLRSELIAKQKLISQLDGKGQLRNPTISHDRDNSGIEESNYDKRMLYEKKRKFKKYQKDELKKHTGRSMGSLGSQLKLNKTQNTGSLQDMASDKGKANPLDNSSTEGL